MGHIICWGYQTSRSCSVNTDPVLMSYALSTWNLISCTRIDCGDCLCRARWLTCPDPDAEELFRMVGEVFIYWSKSHVSVLSSFPCLCYSPYLPLCSSARCIFPPFLSWHAPPSPGSFLFLFIAELQKGGAELCGDERDQQHVLPYRWQ